MPQPPKIQQILDDLAFFTDRAERVQALIDLSEGYRAFQSHRPLPEDHRVPGCESEVFAWTFADDGKARLEFVVDNPQGISAMALAVILKQGLDGEPLAVLRQVDEGLVYEVFGSGLSMGKSGGLTNMIRMVKAQATGL